MRADTLDAPLAPERARACRQAANLGGFRYACPECAREPMAGAVVAFVSAKGLRAHLFEAHGLLDGQP